MGLLDILNGMQNGPRGTQSTDGKGGMSPLTMALLGLLAYKAVKQISGGQSGGVTTPAPAPSGGTVASGGGLGGLLGGGGGSLGGLLGGLLAGSAAGRPERRSRRPHEAVSAIRAGEVANSWVSQGDNKPISPGDLSKALGEDQISSLMQHSGMSRDELLSGLSQVLPAAVNHLTPNGRLPDEQEASRLL